MMKKQVSWQKTIRSLHRDIGFLLIGLTVLYCLSGMLLIFRDTEFLKVNERVEKTFKPNLDENGLRTALRWKGPMEAKKEGELLRFRGGTYHIPTGKASFVQKRYPEPIEKLVTFHKVESQKVQSILGILFGVLLLLMAISSFWMFQPDSKKFKRGVLFSLLGLAMALVVVII